MSAFHSARPLAVVVLLTLTLAAGTIRAEETPPAEKEPLGNTLIPFPFYFYSPETKSGGGLSVSYVVREEGEDVEARPDSYATMLLYTQRSQYTAGLTVDRYFREERWHVNLSTGFSEFPTTYYGVGNGTLADISEDYTPRTFSFAMGIERRVWGLWRTGPVFSFADEEIVEREEDAVLVDPSVLGGEGGTVVTVGWAAVRDARDRVFYPRRGTWTRLEWTVTDGALGADFDFSRQTADLRWYRSLGEETWGSPVWAVRGLMVHTAGSPPFQLLAPLGGQQLLRGYYEGRFRDRQLWALQSEIRVGHWKRMGAVAFAAAGDVGHRVSDFRLDQIQSVWGLGLRVQLSRSEGIQIRADLGVNDEGESGFYLGFLEAY